MKTIMLYHQLHYQVYSEVSILNYISDKLNSLGYAIKFAEYNDRTSENIPFFEIEKKVFGGTEAGTVMIEIYVGAYLNETLTKRKTVSYEESRESYHYSNGTAITPQRLPAAKSIVDFIGKASKDIFKLLEAESSSSKYGNDNNSSKEGEGKDNDLKFYDGLIDDENDVDLKWD